MLQHRLLVLAIVLVHMSALPSREAQAQQAQQGYSQINPRPTHRGPTLSDVWGPPKMPPEPKDFGPHFDFPAGGSQNLTCGPSSGSQYFCGARQRPPICISLLAKFCFVLPDAKHPPSPSTM